MKFGTTLVLPLLIFLFSATSIFAKSGCCSWHGGVSGCDTSTGRQVCNDGTYSPSCTCAYIAPTVTQVPVYYTPAPRIRPTIVSTPTYVPTNNPSLTALPTQTEVPTPKSTLKPLTARESFGTFSLSFFSFGLVAWWIWKKSKRKVS